MSIAIGEAGRAAHPGPGDDGRYGHDKGAATGRFYADLRDSDRAFRSIVDEFTAGDRVLEIGCGVDSIGFELAARGVDVVSIDVSRDAVETTALAAARQGLTYGSFLVMSAEALEWPDDSFDGVVGAGVLHHVDLACTYAEVARVLRPGGVAAFLEPLGHNVAINRYRRRTRSDRRPFEHPLRREDLSLGSRYFDSVRTETHHLVSILTSPTAGRRGGRIIHRLASATDRFLLANLKSLRWHAWIAVVELREPA